MLSVQQDSEHDISRFPEKANKYCGYCPINDACDTYRQHTLDFEAMKNRLLPDNVADRLEKLKVIAKLVEGEIERAKEQLIIQLKSGLPVVSSAGTQYVLSHSTERKVKFWPFYNRLVDLINENGDEELWQDLSEMAGDLFTAKVTGVDKLLKKHPYLKDHVQEFIVKEESEEESLKADKKTKNSSSK